MSTLDRPVHRDRTILQATGPVVAGQGSGAGRLNGAYRSLRGLATYT